MRSTFHLCLYRRSTRPSCVFGRVRQLSLCGAISSMPWSTASLKSSGSLSYALSPIRRSGFSSATKHSETVCSTRVTSCGEAAATCTATGRPLPSATAMIFVPLPRLVAPTSSPHFWRWTRPHHRTTDFRNGELRKDCRCEDRSESMGNYHRGRVFLFAFNTSSQKLAEDWRREQC